VAGAWESSDASSAIRYLFLKGDPEKTGAAAKIAGKASEREEKKKMSAGAASNKTLNDEDILAGLMILPGSPFMFAVACIPTQDGSSQRQT